LFTVGANRDRRLDVLGGHLSGSWFLPIQLVLGSANEPEATTNKARPVKHPGRSCPRTYWSGRYSGLDAADSPEFFPTSASAWQSFALRVSFGCTRDI
jgi:hypothetical protein